MKRLPVLATVTALLTTLLVTSCGLAKASAKAVAGLQLIATAQRKAAPDISGPTLQGGHVDLAALRGKIVLINVWGSWCAPCRAETPGLERVYRQTHAEGVEFLGIDERDSRTNGQEFLRTYKVTYPSLFDEDGSIVVKFRDLPPTAVPTTLILDRQGRIAARSLSPVVPTDVSTAIRRLLAETP